MRFLTEILTQARVMVTTGTTRVELTVEDEVRQDRTPTFRSSCIPTNGSMRIRFIQDPEEWLNYAEHRDQVARTSFPCNGKETCPGCVSGASTSSQYLANVLDLDGQPPEVVPLRLPRDLALRLVVKYETWGTLTSRDIELSRSGEGLDTVYDFGVSAEHRKRLDKHTPADLAKVLEDADPLAFGADGEDDPDDILRSST